MRRPRLSSQSPRVSSGQCLQLARRSQDCYQKLVLPEWYRPHLSTAVRCSEESGVHQGRTGSDKWRAWALKSQPGKPVGPRGKGSPRTTLPVAERGLEMHNPRAVPGAPAPHLAPQAEYDAMLLEHAGEAIPALAAAAGGHAFAPFFASFLPLLLCKMKQSCTVAEKSFAVGTLAESIQGLGPASAQFVTRLFPILLNTAREADPEVRSNAIFGLGVLVEHGGSPAQEYFPKLLGLLLPLLARERHDRVRDNICGALARVLMASPTRKAEPQVLATLLHALPLKEDMEEWITVGCLFHFLHQNNPDQLVDVAPELLRICSLILPDNRIPPDTKAALLVLLTFLAKQHADSFHAALGSLPADKALELQAVLDLT